MMSPWRTPAGWPSHYSPEVIAMYEAACTDRQLQALRLAAHGYGYRRIGPLLGISRDGARYLVEAGLANAARAAAASTAGTAILHEGAA